MLHAEHPWQEIVTHILYCAGYSSQNGTGSRRSLCTTTTVAMKGTQPAALEQKPRRKVKYATLFWVVFTVLTLLFIIDRLTINIVPRQAFNIRSLGYTTGTDHHDFPTSPWTATLHEIVSRLSGRYNMVALNALFFTMMHTLHAKMASSRLAEYIDFSDHSAPIIIHEKIGLSICIITIIHVWGILFPTLFEGYSVGVTVGTLTFPLSERAPGISRDIDEVARKVTMQADDAWRLVSTESMEVPGIDDGFPRSAYVHLRPMAALAVQARYSPSSVHHDGLFHRYHQTTHPPPHLGPECPRIPHLARRQHTRTLLPPPVRKNAQISPQSTLLASLLEEQ